MEKQEYIKLHQEATDIVDSMLCHWGKLNCSISVRKLYENHGEDALKGIVGLHKLDGYDVDVLGSVIAHDLPVPGNEKADIVPKALSFAKYY